MCLRIKGITNDCELHINSVTDRCWAPDCVRHWSRGWEWWTSDTLPGSSSEIQGHDLPRPCLLWAPLRPLSAVSFEFSLSLQLSTLLVLCETGAGNGGQCLVHSKHSRSIYWMKKQVNEWKESMIIKNPPVQPPSEQTMELMFKPTKAQHSSWHKKGSTIGLLGYTE